MQAGDPIEVHWRDIVGSSTGDPDDAEPASCTTLGYFHRWKGRGRNRSLVVHLTRYAAADYDPTGYDAYPVNIIDGVVMLTTKATWISPVTR